MTPLLAGLLLPDAFDTSATFPITSLVLIGAGLMAILLAAWGYRQYQSGQLETAPLMTFHRIASHLDLSFAQQWLMVRIARQQALETPLTMLLCEGTFRHHALLYLEHAPPSRRHREQVTLNAIARCVFGEKMVMG